MAVGPAVAVEEPAVEADADAEADFADELPPVPECTRVGHATTRRRYLSSSAACVGCAPKVVFGSDFTKVRSAWFWAWACAKACCFGLVAEDVGRDAESVEDTEEPRELLGGEGARRSWKPAFVAAFRRRRRIRARFDSGVVAAPGAVAVEEVWRDVRDVDETPDILEADEGQRLWWAGGEDDD